MRKLKQITFLSFIFIITVAFNFQDNPPSNWTQQFLPNIGKRQIIDMKFLDSLTGFISTSNVSDTAYLLKTTDGGNTWTVKLRVSSLINRIQFLNNTTGYLGGIDLRKTTNAGENWFTVSSSLFASDIQVLNQDTLWYVLSESLTGGIFRTTNGGVNWTQQLSAGIYNPTNIYFYNKNLGFAANNQGGKLYRTTNAGENWTYIKNVSFFDIEFADNLTGWMSTGTQDTSVQKTTDGGLTWVTQKVPRGGTPIQLSGAMVRLTVINKDTAWGVGGYAFYPNSTVRAVLYHTTNGGTNWLYQMPDTSINSGTYYYIDFINKNNGWAYNDVLGGIHTTTGGDTTFLSDIRQLSNEIPDNFILRQNFPNPFNPVTIINYQLTINSFVNLKVYNLQGKEIITLIDKRQAAGTYQVDFNANEYSLSSGIYFYTLKTEKFIDTKKMMLIK